ncbi:hypothetical protein LZ30DRAFT_637195, partial [Colletotrichum cereale]
MDQCYINLVPVEQHDEHPDRQRGRSEDPKLPPLSFSSSSRLKIETPHGVFNLELLKLFDKRPLPDGYLKRPQRILIRGRAEMGKTTLCKKIVHEFTHQNMSQGLFDRLLWVPLRDLKQKAHFNIPVSNVGDLLRHGYFPGPEAEHLTEAISGENQNSNKALFILDGLDEVPSDLDGDMFRILEDLLNQPNIILTSRPHAV